MHSLARVCQYGWLHFVFRSNSAKKSSFIKKNAVTGCFLDNGNKRSECQCDSTVPVDVMMQLQELAIEGDIVPHFAKLDQEAAHGRLHPLRI